MRATKNVVEEEKRFRDFQDQVLTPALAHSVANSLNGSTYQDPIKMTKREIRDRFGLAASDVFCYLFKLLKRGGYSDRSLKGYKSVWLYNEAGLRAYADWIEKDQPEKTCRALRFALIDQGCEKIEWCSQMSAWTQTSLRKITIQAKREEWIKKRAEKVSSDEIEEYNAKYH